MNFKELFSTQKILVVGDSILDHYVYGKVHRVSPEAPVPVVLKNREEFFLGGAANVAQNITTFGANCTLLSLVGNDVDGKILFKKCIEKNITPIFIEEESRPTTKKTRVIGNKQKTQLRKLLKFSTNRFNLTMELFFKIMGKGYLRIIF
jgi:rfaE bifunctional protein kinase chain/domain